MADCIFCQEGYDHIKNIFFLFDLVGFYGISSIVNVKSASFINMVPVV